MVYDNNGTYGWAASSSAGPTYTLTNYTQETTLSTTNANGSTASATDYVVTASVTATAAQAMNFLRVNNTTTTAATYTSGTGNAILLGNGSNNGGGVLDGTNTAFTLSGGTHLQRNQWRHPLLL